MSGKNEYHKLYEAAIKAYPDKKKQKVQQEVEILWKRIKKGDTNIEEEYKRFDNIYKKTQGGLLKFWSSAPKAAAVSSKAPPDKPANMLSEVSLEMPTNVLVNISPPKSKKKK